MNCSPPLRAAGEGMKEKVEKRRRRGWRRAKYREGYEKSRERGGKKKILGPVLSIFFFFKQWHPVFLDVSLLWQL